MVSELKTGKDIFQCKQCGECCNGFGGTYVTKEDIKNIAEYIHIDIEKFISDFCDTSGRKYVLTQGKDDKCIFFDSKKQCTIHPVKPYMCKAWPFIQAIVKFPENWDAMAGSCPGMKKNIPHNILKKIVSDELKALQLDNEQE